MAANEPVNLPKPEAVPDFEIDDADDALTDALNDEREWKGAPMFE